MHGIMRCLWLSIGIVSSAMWCRADDALNLPSGYGSTHFIIGAPVVAHSPKKDERALQEEYIDKVLFSPDDDIRSHLITLIDQERHAIKVTIFLLTDPEIAQALINAHQRGVGVEIVADPKHMYDRFSRIEQVCTAGICVYVFNPKYNDPAGVGLMHNKFVIFGTQHQSSGCVWAGSFNFTRAARECNQEHVVVIKGASIVQRFSEQFESLKGRCTRYNAQRPDTSTK